MNLQSKPYFTPVSIFLFFFISFNLSAQLTVEHTIEQAVDTDQLLETTLTSTGLVNSYFAIAPNAVTPVSQVDPYSHLARITNSEDEALMNVSVKLSVVDDATSTVVFTDNATFDNLAVNQTVDLSFPEFFTPDGNTPSTYTTKYKFDAEGINVDSLDSTISYSMMTSDTVFAKDFEIMNSIRPANNNWETEEPHSWAYGNYYRIVDGENWNASSATFSIGATAENEDDILGVYLYKWEGDLNGNGEVDPFERTRVGANFHLIQGTETAADLITIPLLKFPDFSPLVELESDTDYILMLEYSIAQTGKDIEIGRGQGIYNAMIDRSQFSRHASFVTVGNPEDQNFLPGSLFGNFVAVARLNISPIGTTSTSNIVDAEGLIKVFPNPTTDHIQFQSDPSIPILEDLELYDMTGRLVKSFAIVNMAEQLLTLDISSLHNGVYILKIKVEDGFVIKKVIKQ